MDVGSTAFHAGRSEKSVPEDATVSLPFMNNVIRVLLTYRMMEERSAILQFTTYWRQQAHNPYLMGRPEVQVVLLALAETAQM
jgi:hypothetical protein